MNIPDAPPALRSILYALPKDGNGLVVTQHAYHPKPDEWFVGIEHAGYGGGDLGPYQTAEQALIKGVQWLYALYRARDDHDRYWTEEQNEDRRGWLNMSNGEEVP